MAGVKVSFEIGHEASLRSKKTPEGFTHDWEVFVRGQEGADISHFVEKVVFQLHETFKKPRRVVKDPPFIINESGYAGFMLPIEIYLKNKDEPKKIKFMYDFTLQQSGFLKDRYIFPSPNEDFKKKLLKGGGFITNNSYYTNPDQESQSKSRDSFGEDKQQLLSKPKLSSENVKKHKAKEHKDETPHKTSSFENLFGSPIQKPPKISPDPKKLDKVAPPPPPPPVKSDKKDKERSNSDKKTKHEHKESKQDKVKIKEEKEKAKQEKIKNYNKEQEKSKDKATKRPSERPLSPDIIKKSRISPRRPPSPPPRSNSASSMKEEYKVQKHTEPESRKHKLEEKPPEPKPDKEQKEKKKKEKKSHDRDKERKERKEHKKENHKSKESPVSKELTKELKARETPTPKEKESTKDTIPVKEKQLKPEKPINKFSLETFQKTLPSADLEEKSSHHKNKDKSDSERKHKHKKKDKKRDESKDKHKESSKEKKHKHEKVREMPVEKPEVIEHRDTPVQKEPPPQELGSPISIDTASQCSSKSGLAKMSHVIDDINSSHSDSENSMIADDEKSKLNIASPEPVKEHFPDPEPEPEPEMEPEPELEPIIEVPLLQPKEKSKKHKDKSSKREEKREEKRRKRKAAEDEDIEKKVAKTAVVAEPGPAPAFIETERGESSGSLTTETKVQDNGVSSSLGEDAEPGDLSPDYMVQLRDLQQRIMKIRNNEDLERVVNLIAETGRYEVTTQTFDFDLCLLDRSTVQQLKLLVGC